MTADSSVLEKIRKLLALAEGNQNQHERESAMQFAMDLLAKHNLTTAELSPSQSAAGVCEMQMDVRAEPWVKTVLQVACMLYYTDYYNGWRMNGASGAMRLVPVFVGTPDNLAVAIEVSTWLLDSIRRESNRAYKDPYERKSFRLGAAHSLFMRAIDLLVDERSTRSEAPGTSLIVIREKLERANEEYLSKLNLRETRRKRSYVDPDAFDMGEAFGETVPLSRAPSDATAVEAAPKQLRALSALLQINRDV